MPGAEAPPLTPRSARGEERRKTETPPIWAPPLCGPGLGRQRHHVLLTDVAEHVPLRALAVRTERGTPRRDGSLGGGMRPRRRHRRRGGRAGRQPAHEVNRAPVSGAGSRFGAIDYIFGCAFGAALRLHLPHQDLLPGRGLARRSERVFGRRRRRLHRHHPREQRQQQQRSAARRSNGNPEGLSRDTQDT